MPLMRRHLCFALLVICLWAGSAAAQGLHAAGAPRYGRQQLAPGFAPDPASFSAQSGGDVDVKSLRLGDNCLGYAAGAPDFVIELAAAFDRITFLIASEADTTLIMQRPNGSWACNDDSNGLNPALVFFQAAAGDYRIWIGSYAEEAYDEAALFVSTAGPETLPTTATGPEPGQAPTYGEVSLAPGFRPAPFSTQLIGGGRNRAQDFIAGGRCHGYIAEAPDYSILLDAEMSELWIAFFSPAAMTLVVNAADGAWHCSDAHSKSYPSVAFRFAWAGLYDVWVGSAEAGNYAAGILTVSENAPEPAMVPALDTGCPDLPPTDLRVGIQAAVLRAAGSPLYLAPETASTEVFRAPGGSSLALIGGPICQGGQRWWRAAFDGGRAWVADGNGGAPWLAPAP